MSFCPSCGGVLGPGVMNCPKCGSPAGTPAVTPSPSPFAAQQDYGQQMNRLPDVSPLAIILAAASWIIGGILCSIPAVFIARSDIRGCREGRYNPAGLGQSNLAFWIAMVNIIFTFLVCGGFIVFFVFIAGAVGVAAKQSMEHAKQMEARRAAIEAKETIEVEKEVETKMASRSQEEKELWAKVKVDWNEARRDATAGGVGSRTTVKPLNSPSMDTLLTKVSGDEELWLALTVLEGKVAKETNRQKPARIRSTLPSESTHYDDD